MQHQLTDRKIVKQSTSLSYAKFTLSALSLDILHLLFAQISHDDVDFKEFKMTFKEIEKKLGKEINSNYIPNIAIELSTTPIIIHKEKSTLVCSFVSSAEYSKEEGWLSLKVADGLKKYLLNVENKFVLSSYVELSKLRGMYSKRIYTIMKQYMTTGYFVTSLSDFMYQLDVENKYGTYSDFKKRVLAPAIKEINEKSDLNFSINEVKVSKKVSRLEFFIKKSPSLEVKPAPKIKKIIKYKDGTIAMEKWLAKKEGREFLTETDEVIIKSSSPSWMQKMRAKERKESRSDLSEFLSKYSDAIDTEIVN